MLAASLPFLGKGTETTPGLEWPVLLLSPHHPLLHRPKDGRSKATRGGNRGERGCLPWIMGGGATEAHTAGQRPDYLHLSLCIVSGKETKAGWLSGF